MKCDLNCPPIMNNWPDRTKRNKKYCCQHCDIVADNGCSLDREDVPDKCKEYDCKQFKLYIVYMWSGTEWVANSVLERPIESCDKDFIDRYNDLVRRYV